MINSVVLLRAGSCPPMLADMFEAHGLKRLGWHTVRFTGVTAEVNLRSPLHTDDGSCK